MALKRFIDDIAVEAVEAKLVSRLHEILLPVSIYAMSDDQVSRIASESEGSRTQREQLARQLDVLRKGLEICNRLASLSVSRVNNPSFPSLR